MKALIKKFIIFIFLFLSACCKKEKECDTRCQVDQFCDDGVCKCRNDQFTLGNRCIDRCGTCYEGAISCGCMGKYIIDTKDFDKGSVTLIIPGPSPDGYVVGSSDATRIADYKYKFSIPKFCDIGDRRCTDLEFIVDVSDSLQLKVDARYLILPSNETLAKCSAVFTR